MENLKTGHSVAVGQEGSGQVHGFHARVHTKKLQIIWDDVIVDISIKKYSEEKKNQICIHNLLQIL